MIFMTPRVKIRIKGHGIEIYVKTRFFCISETRKTRHKRVNSVKACKLQSQLAIGKLGGELHNFLKMY
jgi:hypothetical protein